MLFPDISSLYMESLICLCCRAVLLVFCVFMEFMYCKSQVVVFKMQTNLQCVNNKNSGDSRDSLPNKARCVSPQSQRASRVRCPLISLRTCWSHFMASGQQSVNTAVLAVPACSRSAPPQRAPVSPFHLSPRSHCSSAPVTDQNNIFTRNNREEGAV